MKNTPSKFLPNERIVFAVYQENRNIDFAKNRIINHFKNLISKERIKFQIREDNKIGVSVIGYINGLYKIEKDKLRKL